MVNWASQVVGASCKEPFCQCKRHNRCRLDPWLGKIPWRSAQQSTPVPLPRPWRIPWTEESASVQFSLVAQSCPTLCDPMNCSTPGLPAHHQPPKFTQTHVHRVSDAIQPSHPLSSLSPPAPNPSPRQSLFQWVNSSHKVAKVLEF